MNQNHNITMAEWKHNVHFFLFCRIIFCDLNNLITYNYLVPFSRISAEFLQCIQCFYFHFRCTLFYLLQCWNEDLIVFRVTWLTLFSTRYLLKEQELPTINNKSCIMISVPILIFNDMISLKIHNNCMVLISIHRLILYTKITVVAINALNDLKQSSTQFGINLTLNHIVLYNILKDFNVHKNECLCPHKHVIFLNA